MASLGYIFNTGHCVLYVIFGACVCLCEGNQRKIVTSCVVLDRDKKEGEQVDAEGENEEVKV